VIDSKIQHPVNILVVEHTARFSFLVEILKPHGYNIKTVSDEPLTFSPIGATLPDLILLDLTMPEWGYELCEKLKANGETSHIPIIFISAKEGYVDKQRVFSSGAADYLTEPFEVNEVLKRVETELTLQTMQRSLDKMNDRLVQEIVTREQTTKTLQNLNERVQSELALAKEIQSSLLLPPCPKFPDIEIICHTIAAREVGGDFYAYHASQHARVLLSKYTLAIGDVSGKGVSAALLMATSLSQFDASLSMRFTRPSDWFIWIKRLCLIPNRAAKIAPCVMWKLLERIRFGQC